MSALLENTLDEVEVLEGATIEKIWVQKGSVGWGEDEECLRMRVRFRKDLKVNGNTHGEYELWQDCEGNGPGFIALVA